MHQLQFYMMLSITMKNNFTAFILLSYCCFFQNMLFVKCNVWKPWLKSKHTLNLIETDKALVQPFILKESYNDCTWPQKCTIIVHIFPSQFFTVPIMGYMSYP